MKTRSQPPAILLRCGRTASRIIRRARLRLTAPPTRRLADIPTRTRPKSLANAPKINKRLTHERPETRTRSKSRLLRNRLSRGIPTPTLGVPVGLFHMARCDSQTMASLAAPSLDHISPATRLHTRAEPVYPCPSTFLRLISPFRGHVVRIPPTR
jgi:hypothetical protein